MKMLTVKNFFPHYKLCSPQTQLQTFVWNRNKKTHKFCGQDKTLQQYFIRMSTLNLNTFLAFTLSVRALKFQMKFKHKQRPCQYLKFFYSSRWSLISFGSKVNEIKVENLLRFNFNVWLLLLEAKMMFLNCPWRRKACIT